MWTLVDKAAQLFEPFNGLFLQIMGGKSVRGARPRLLNWSESVELTFLDFHLFRLLEELICGWNVASTVNGLRVRVNPNPNTLQFNRIRVRVNPNPIPNTLLFNHIREVNDLTLL